MFLDYRSVTSGVWCNRPMGQEDVEGVEESVVVVGRIELGVGGDDGIEPMIWGLEAVETAIAI